MRIVYASDLHGDKALYKSLLELINKNNANILIIGGDIFEYERSDLKQIEFVEEFLKDYFQKVAIPIYIISGNTDWSRPFRKLTDLPGLLFLTLKAVELPKGTVNILGYNKVNPTPFSIKVGEKRDLKEDNYRYSGAIYNFDVNGHLQEQPSTYLNDLPSIEEDLFRIKNAQPSIWVMHAPPYGTALDVMKNKIHIGSKAVRNSIERHQPTLTLHGHVHESPYVSGKWVDEIGDTICINPGRGSKLHAAIIDIGDEGNIIKMEHTIFGEKGK